MPISIARALSQSFGDAKWWAEQGAVQAARYLTPYGWAYSASVGVVGIIRKVEDPTRASIPLVGDNPEAKFFSMLQKLRSADGSSFGSAVIKGPLSTSERARWRTRMSGVKKGSCRPANSTKSFGVVGQYKLDWMFILPPNLDKPKDKHGTAVLAPHYGRTLKALNRSIPQRLSDLIRSRWIYP